MFHQFVSYSCWTIINFGLIRSNKRGVQFEYGSLFLGGTGKIRFLFEDGGGRMGKYSPFPALPSLAHLWLISFFPRYKTLQINDWQMFVLQCVFPASHPNISPPLSWFMYPFHSLFSRTPSLTMIPLLSHFLRFLSLSFNFTSEWWLKFLCERKTLPPRRLVQAPYMLQT